MDEATHLSREGSDEHRKLKEAAQRESARNGGVLPLLLKNNGLERPLHHNSVMKRSV